MFGDLPSPFTLLGRLHCKGPGASGAPGARREAECRGCSRPVGQSLMGTALRHQRWWGALQYPSSPTPLEEPHRPSCWPSLRISSFLFKASRYTFVLVQFYIWLRGHQRRHELKRNSLSFGNFSRLSSFLLAPRMLERELRSVKLLLWMTQTAAEVVGQYLCYMIYDRFW